VQTRELTIDEVDAVNGGLVFLLALAPAAQFFIGFVAGAAAAGGALYVAEQD